MGKNKAISALVLAGLGTLSGQAGAWSAGALSNYSFLSEPLNAWVDVQGLNGGEETLKTAKITIASPAQYEAAGVPRPSVVDQIKVKLTRADKDRWGIKLTSQQVLATPALTLILNIEMEGQTETKKYALLLDLRDKTVTMDEATASPAIKNNEKESREFSDAFPSGKEVAKSDKNESIMDSVQKTKSNAGTDRANKEVSESKLKSPNAVKEPMEGSEVKVKRGAILAALAQSYLSEGVTLNQMMVAFVEKNPHAFVKGNANRLKSGVMLSVPSTQEAQKWTSHQAAQKIKEQVSAFNQWKNTIAVDHPVKTIEKTDHENSKGTVEGAVEHAPKGQMLKPLKEVKSTPEIKKEAQDDKLSLESGKEEVHGHGLSSTDKVAGQKALDDLNDRMKKLQQLKSDLLTVMNDPGHEKPKSAQGVKEVAKAEIPAVKEESKEAQEGRNKDVKDEKTTQHSFDAPLETDPKTTSKPSKYAEDPTWIGNTAAVAEKASEVASGVKEAEGSASAAEEKAPGAAADGASKPKAKPLALMIKEETPKPWTESLMEWWSEHEMQSLSALGTLLGLGGLLGALKWKRVKKEKALLQTTTTLGARKEIEGLTKDSTITQEEDEDSLRYRYVKEVLDRMDTFIAFRQWTKAKSEGQEALMAEWGKNHEEILLRMARIAHGEGDRSSLESAIKQMQENQAKPSVIEQAQNLLDQMNDQQEQEQWDENRVDQGLDLEAELGKLPSVSEVEIKEASVTEEVESLPSLEASDTIDFKSSTPLNVEVEIEVPSEKANAEDLSLSLDEVPSLDASELNSLMEESGKTENHQELSGDLDGLSMDMEDEPDASDMKQVEYRTMYELAQTYIEMGDKNEAKELLSEVLKGASGSIKREAQALIKTLD